MLLPGVSALENGLPEGGQAGAGAVPWLCCVRARVPDTFLPDLSDQLVGRLVVASQMPDSSHVPGLSSVHDFAAAVSPAPCSV